MLLSLFKFSNSNKQIQEGRYISILSQVINVLSQKINILSHIRIYPVFNRIFPIIDMIVGCFYPV
jgi:hypothetical protein